jgi:hypothetical protein
MREICFAESGSHILSTATKTWDVRNMFLQSQSVTILSTAGDALNWVIKVATLLVFLLLIPLIRSGTGADYAPPSDTNPVSLLLLPPWLPLLL